jgi:hypothetical protein
MSKASFAIPGAVNEAAGALAALLTPRRSQGVFDVVNGKVLRVGHDLVGRYPGARANNIGIRFDHARLGPKNYSQCDDHDNNAQPKVSTHVKPPFLWAEELPATPAMSARLRSFAETICDAAHRMSD